MLQPPEDAAEEAQDAAGVALCEIQTSEQEMQVAPVGFAHDGRRVIGGEHGGFDNFGQEIEVGGSGRRFRRLAGGGLRISTIVPCGDFIQADGNGLAQIHGGLAGIGGDFDEQMAMGEVVGGEATLFRAEDERDAAAAFELTVDRRGEMGQRDDLLLGFAAGEGCGADHERAVGDGLLQGCGFAGLGEELRRPDGGFGLTPVRLMRRHDGQAAQAEVSHGAGGRSYIEGIARRDEDDADAVELG